MDKIDLRSVYALLAFMNFFIPLVTWGVTRKESSRAINYWCLGGMLGAIGTMMSAFNNPTYQTGLIVLTEIFLLFSILYRIEGIFSFLNARQNMIVWIPITILLSVVSANPYLDFQQTAVIIHAIFYSRLIYYLFKLGLRSDGKSIWFTCVGYVLTVVVLISIAIQMNIGLIPSNYLNANIWTLALAFLGAFVIFSGYVGVVGVVLERNRARELNFAEEKARLESSRLLTDQISSLQRKRIVDQMSSTLAHELSQPLSIAMSGTQSIQRQLKRMSNGDENEIAVHMDVVINSLKRMSSLLDRIRAFLKAQPLQFERKSLNIFRVVNEVVEMLSWHASRKDVKIKLETPNNSLKILGDRIQITQVLTNIIMNAIDSCVNSATDIKKITVSIVVQEESISVQVRDTGNGFTLESISRAGEPFYTTKSDGLGLGLSICNSIVEKHGAKLSWFNSSPYGAVVKIDFPRSNHNPLVA